MSDKTSPIREYESTVNALYAVYLDSRRGFVELLRLHKYAQRQTINLLSKKNPELANQEYLDSVDYIYGKGDPNQENSIALQRNSQGDYGKRISPDGSNNQFIGNMKLVSLYQYWEDKYRGTIANYLDLNKDEIKSDIMGDIRRHRHSIIHHDSVALDDISKCTLLTWYKPGESIFIQADQMEQMVSAIYEMLSDMSRKKPTNLDA
jgi:hypothetical protein